MAIDYDHELSNGWGKWENVVLMALKELKEGQATTNKDVGDLKTAVALINQSISKNDDYGRRLGVLETNVVTQEEVKKERRWIYVTAMALVGSIVLPALAVVISNIHGVHL